MFKLLGFILFIISSLGSTAQAAVECQPTMELDVFKRLVEETKDRYFPELSSEKIEVKTFISDAYFLQAQPVLQTFVGSRKNRAYSVQLNLKLLACPPTVDALVAILVHELEHIKDYRQWSTAKIIKHGALYTSSLNFKSEYERATDLKVLNKGLNSGLAGYREWVYQWLNPRELKRKKVIYLTPEEIMSL